MPPNSAVGSRRRWMRSRGAMASVIRSMRTFSTRLPNARSKRGSTRIRPAGDAGKRCAQGRSGDMDAAGGRSMNRIDPKLAATLRQPAELIDHGLAPASQLADLERVAARYAIAVTPDIAALIDTGNPD